MIMWLDVGGSGVGVAVSFVETGRILSPNWIGSQHQIVYRFIAKSIEVVADDNELVKHASKCVRNGTLTTVHREEY